MEENLSKEQREKLHEQEIQNKINQDKSKKTIKKIIIYSIIVLVIASIIYFPLVNSKKPGKYDDFAKCLTEKEVKFYGSFQCSACAKQKQLFGNSMKYINYIECGPLSGPQNQICKDVNVRVYPTWVILNETREGILSLEELAQTTNCSLPQV